MEIQNQEEIKTSHLALSFSVLGLIALLCAWVWQGKDILNYVADLFSFNRFFLNVGIGVGLGILLAVIAIVLVKLTGTKIPDEKNELLKDIMMSAHGAIIVAVLPGVFEEILFRGFVQPFIQSFTNPTWAVIITTIVFWVIHIPQYKTKIVLNLCVIMLSVVTGILLVITETLWASIFAHMVYNYLVTVASQKKIINI